ncbi:hemocyanin AA6 chain-like [Antedon mediterranea]|uniref:hemocyanin AA6 chain-like n=1 Tax=Antedon mediterranea TaxID=105859 RepID=UPI003AF5516E
MKRSLVFGALVLLVVAAESSVIEKIVSDMKENYKVVENTSLRNKRAINTYKQKATLGVLTPADPIDANKAKNVNLPPGVGLLPRGEKFSIFVDAHREEATSVIQYLQSAEDFDVFITIATIFRDNINTELWLFAFHVAIQNRDDATGVRIPPVFQLQAQAFFVNGQIDQATAEAQLPGTSQIVRGLDLDLFSTSNRRDPESRLAYFREDIGFNFYHWQWHVSNGFFLVKDRQGELFYYTHQQILARYDTERLAAGLTRVLGLHEWNKPIVEGYNPDLSGCNGLGGYSTRPSNMVLCGGLKSRSNLNLPIPDGENILVMLQQQRDRIAEAIRLERFTLPDGSTVPVDINNLGQAIEASIASPNPQLYGLIGLHAWGHILLSFITDPDGRYNTEPGAMFDTRTSNRDPVFYRWHKFIDDVFVTHKATLPPYTRSEIAWDEVRLSDIKIKTTRGTPSDNTLYTYMEEEVIDISKDIYFEFDQSGNPIKVRNHHLNHEAFKYEITVRQTSGSASRATVRIFMAPRYDEIGQLFRFNDQRRLFFEMDKFDIALTRGTTTYTRFSHDSTLISQVASTFAKVEEAAQTGVPLDQCTSDQHCDCGWPANLLVPKGSFEGQEFDLFVMLTDFDEDISSPGAEYRPGVSLCGRGGDGIHPDTKPMGYPFDRPVSVFGTQDFEQWLNTFGATNVRTRVVKIFHQGFREPAPDPFADLSSSSSGF